MVNWAVAGVLYAAVYGVTVAVLGDRIWERLLAGNIALLLPPLATLAVVVRRRRDWRGRDAVFWAAIAAWAALWWVGQISWAADELVFGTTLPWFKWPIILQLCASALPLLALVAWPHRPSSDETAVAAALDITVLAFLTGFLYWSLIIAPGMEPSRAPVALRTLAIIGPSIRAAAVAGFLGASISAGRGAWSHVYRRFASGFALAFGVLVLLSLSTVRGDYQTGSPGDVGWMLPFFFAAYAAADAPVSMPAMRSRMGALPQHASPALLFTALLTVTIVGFGIRFVTPISASIDALRDAATAFTLIAGLALVMVRLRVERAAGDRESERVRLLAAACRNAGDLMMVVSRGNRIEYANDACCRALGYPVDELEAVNPTTLFAGSPDGIPGFEQSVATRSVTRTSAEARRKDGTTFHAACVAAPILDADGNVTHIVAVVRDLTEDLRLRDQVVRGERLSAIGEVVSGVAHELNNPLQAMIGTLEISLAQPQAAAVAADLERIRFEAGRAARIVRNLLAFVQRAPKERVLIDLNEAVKATVAVRAYEIEMAGVQLREDYAAVLPLVLANRDEIQQLVLNLIMNGQQAMADQTTPRVLSIRTLLDGSDAAVEVRDTGPGLPEAIAGKIFEPFFTGRPAASGPGLGLSTSLGIAQAHGGRLELLPNARGACFRLTLPGAGFAGPVLPTAPSTLGG
jgi:PAS domain S-box-containing protein